MGLLKSIQGIIDWAKKHDPEFKENEISDGYHTFNELYEFRKMYNAVLFNEWGQTTNEPHIDGTIGCKYDVHKSRLHYDGEVPFGDSRWFIVSAMLPTGLISNHYKIEDWDLFHVPITEKAKYEFDGHTGKDVLLRLKDICINH